MTGSTTAPCDSNDSRNDYASSFEPCANEPPQSFFSCDAADAEDLIDAESASPIVLEFDYEIHTPLELGDDISSAIEDFQGSLVAGVADFYGIKECSQRKLRRVESDSRKLGKYSDVTVGEGARGGNAPVVGCASTPSDEPDDKISLCVNEVAISEESNCTPMKGYLTIYTQTSQRRRLNSEEAEEEALVAIQQYIRSSTEYLSSDVLAVSYIGTRDVIPVGILNPDLLLRPGFGNRNLDAPSPGETSLAPLVKREAVAGASLSGLAVVLFAAVQYFKRRHKSSSGIMKRQNSLVSAQHNQAIEVV